MNCCTFEDTPVFEEVDSIRNITIIPYGMLQRFLVSRAYLDFSFVRAN